MMADGSRRARDKQTGRARISTQEYLSPWRSEWAFKPSDVSIVNPPGQQRKNPSPSRRVRGGSKRARHRNSRATWVRMATFFLLFTSLFLGVGILAILFTL